MKIIRVTKESERAGAYYVRIQAMMHKYQIPLDAEVDSHDGADCNYILALDDIYPVATCRWFGLDSESAEIGRVVVLPEYRGQKLGAKVIREAEAWIAECGYTEIAIDSRLEAVGFYEKLGYKLIDRDVVKSGAFDCVRMRKELALASS